MAARVQIVPPVLFFALCAALIMCEATYRTSEVNSAKAVAMTAARATTLVAATEAAAAVARTTWIDVALAAKEMWPLQQNGTDFRTH